MKKLILLLSFALSMLTASIIGQVSGLNPFMVFGGLALISGIVSMAAPIGVALMALEKEIWVNYVMENLFKDNEFLNYCYNADEFVVAGKIVHIPQAGAPSSVARNRSQLPATVTKRTDIDIVYVLEEFTSDPRLIDNAETIELSYPKMENCIGEDVSAVKDLVADWMLWRWAQEASAYIIRTTGGSVVATAPGATGNRKKFLKEDLKKARATMNKAGASKQNRYALFPSDLYEQLTDDADLLKRDYAQELNLPEGVIAKLYGFYILDRASVVYYTASLAKKEPGATGATTDHEAVLCWQKDCVERAIGTVKVFNEDDSPLYYGNIFSSLLRSGGRIRRNDNKGVVAIVQDTI